MAGLKLKSFIVRSDFAKETAQYYEVFLLQCRYNLHRYQFMQRFRRQQSCINVSHVSAPSVASLNCSHSLTHSPEEDISSFYSFKTNYSDAVLPLAKAKDAKIRFKVFEENAVYTSNVNPTGGGGYMMVPLFIMITQLACKAQPVSTQSKGKDHYTAGLQLNWTGFK